MPANNDSKSAAPVMVQTYKDRALAYQVDKEHFVVAYWAKIVLVNLFVDADGLEIVVNKIRNKYKMKVDFNWMADR